jgi:hypothetical protein
MLQDDRLNRRNFIGAGGIALAVAAAPMTWGLAADSLNPYRAIYDERFDAGRAFSAAARRLGWITRAIRGDITTVWFRELSPRWRHGPATVTGITTTQTLFVLERLAWDAGLRVTSRDTSTSPPLVHWVIGLPRLKDRRS